MKPLKTVEYALVTAGAIGAGVLAIRAAGRPREVPYTFWNRVVLITGGSRGLGLVLARKLLREGARVAICARTESDLARAHAELKPLGEVLAITCDVTDPTEVDSLVATVAERLGPVDVLINNAGVISVGPLETMTSDDFRAALDTHVWGPLHTINAVLPEMKRRASGRIVNIASIGGEVSLPHLVPYCMSKFALVGLSHGLTAELAADGILVTTVCPGLMRTGSMVQAEFKGRHREEYSWFSIGASLPLVTLPAERAAGLIIEACRRGEPHVTLSLPAKAAARASAIAPSLTARVLQKIQRMLPSPGGIGTARASGLESRSQRSPSLLTRLGDRAALRNNELPSASTAHATQPVS